MLIRQSDFTITDTRSSGVLAGLGISRKLCPSGGNQAVMCQLLYPQIPGSTAIYPIVPWWDPLIVILPGAICGEDQRLWGGCDAWEETEAGAESQWNKKFNAIFYNILNSLLSSHRAQQFWVYSERLRGCRPTDTPKKKKNHINTPKTVLSGFVFNVALDRNWFCLLKSLSYLSHCSPSHRRKGTLHKRCMSRDQN